MSTFKAVNHEYVSTLLAATDAARATANQAAQDAQDAAAALDSIIKGDGVKRLVVSPALREDLEDGDLLLVTEQGQAWMDFSGYDEGDIVDGSWEAAWSAGYKPTVALVDGDRVLRPVVDDGAASGIYHALIWRSLGVIQSDEVEVLLELRSTSTAGSIVPRPLCRARIDQITGLAGGLRNGLLRISATVDQATLDHDGPEVPYESHTWYFTRLRSTPGGTSIKWWPSGDPEPSEWTYWADEATLSSTPGYVGIYIPAVSASTLLSVRFISVGVGGVPAPGRPE